MIPRSLARLALALPILLVPTFGAAEPLAGIHVNGAGEVRAVPDMARVTVEARREGTDAAALKKQLDEVTAAVLELTREHGIRERDVTAAAVNIYPRYWPQDRDQERPEGVIATRTIEITVRDLAILGELINGALDRGANGIQGVALDVSNRRELEAEALDLAIDDAVQQARQMAKRFQVELGPLKDASTSSHVQPLMRMEAAVADRKMASSFSPGELTIRRDVQATFSIRP